MEEIYRNSRCTIAASGAEDGTGGCFFSRDLRLLEPFSIYIQSPAHKLPRKHTSELSPKTQEKLRRNTLLYRRAWVVQERLLSPRSLHFGKQQVSWGCHELYASETHPNGVHESYINDAQEAFEILRTGQEPKPIDSIFHYDPKHGYDGPALRRWSTIVGTYSQCALTNPQDKLIALSAIAIAVRHRIGRCLAGMWEELLPIELLWAACRQASGDGPFRPQEYRAPSWSWASVEGVITYLMRDLYNKNVLITYFMSIIEVQVTAVDDRKMGQVTGGFMRISGRLGKSVWKKGESSKNLCYHFAVKDALDHELPSKEILHASFDSTDEMNVCSKEVLCLPICGLKNLTNRTLGLMLREISEGNFERLGVFEVSSDEVYKYLYSLPEREIVLV